MSNKSPPLVRWTAIVLRTAHVAGAGLTLGAATFGVEPGRWPMVAALSGIGLITVELSRDGLDWLRWTASWVILAKVGLLALAAASPAQLPAGLWVALVLGGLISHAPGALRQRALWGEPGPCARPPQA